MSGLHRSNVYYEPVPESAEDLRLMRLIEEEYLRHPHLGSRGMVLHLARQGEVVNRKRMQRLLRKMGLQPLAPRPSTTRRAVSHKVYPYLLRSIEVVRPNQVWACDITYVGKNSGICSLGVDAEATGSASSDDPSSRPISASPVGSLPKATLGSNLCRICVRFARLKKKGLTT